MARSYSVVGNSTVAASATLPLAVLTGAATIRPKIFDMEFSSDSTPADAATKYVWQRCTTPGTAGSAFTPVALDAADPAALASAGVATYTVGPTLTANAFLLQFAVNQRATFRWVAAPNKELVIPATASNGLALMTTVLNGTAYNAVWSFSYEE